MKKQQLDKLIQSEGIGQDHQEGIRAIFKFANDINREGRTWSEEDVRYLGETHLIAKTEIEGIFRKVFEDNRDEYGIGKRPPMERAEIYLKKKYDFAHNIVIGDYQMRPKGGKDWEQINENEIYRELRQHGVGVNLTDLRCILGSKFCQDYDPFGEYFSDLPPWDGKTDHIGRLAACVKTSDDYFWDSMFRKALVRSIKCALGVEVNRIIMVLVDQKQETGKTRFIKFLNPFRDWYYTDQTIFGNYKDGELSLTENFIYNLEEVEELTPRELSKLKAIISRSIVRLRRPFGKFAETLRRRCSFWASTNKPEFLSDIQNTRWVCFDVSGIDWRTYVKEINIHDVWGQAWHLYKDGFDSDLTPEEKGRRNIRNMAFEAGGNERDLIQYFFKIPADEAKGEFMTTAQIILHLQERAGDKVRLEPYKTARAMGQLGFKNKLMKVNGHPVRGWVVQKNEATGWDVKGEIETEKLPF